jgi:Cytochrome c peroxidase
MNPLQAAVRTLLLYIALASPLAWADTPATGESTDQRCGGESCAAVLRGFFAFFDRDLPGLDGNGRSCGDCHMATEQFRLTPAAVESRFQFLQKRRRYNPHADDPLFRPIDADDFRINGEQASDYGNLRQNGLIRIVFTLPPNMRLIDPATHQPSDETSVDVWRMVPGVTDLKLTGADGLNPWPRGPNPTGGYQLDGRILTLQDQALGALLNHAQVQNPPPQRLLDDLSSFQLMLVTNSDPRLNALEQQGKAVFTRSCAQCHGGPGQSTTQPPVVRYHDISSQCPRPVDTVTPARWNFQPCPPRLARNARTYEITLPTGATIRRTSSDPGRALLTGFAGVGPPAADDWNKLDVTGLRGLRRTAPYFHNNSAATLEEVVDHYIEFYKRVQAIAPPGVVPPVASTDGVHFDRIPLPEERAALLAYLRKL